MYNELQIHFDVTYEQYILYNLVNQLRVDLIQRVAHYTLNNLRILIIVKYDKYDFESVKEFDYMPLDENYLAVCVFHIDALVLAVAQTFL